jgi:hypothetical protein
MIPYEGACLCSAVRYRVNEAPLNCYVCHCTDCQRRTGSAFAISLFVRRKAVEVVQGTTTAYAAQLADGRSKQGQCCALCATRLWGEPAKAPHIAVIQPGTLDNPTQFQPFAHVWTRSAQPWFVMPLDVLVYERQPDDPMELFRLWRERAERCS